MCTNTTTNGTPCTTANVLTPVGIPEYTIFPYINAGTTKTSGIDVDLRSHFDLGAVGKLSAELNYTYISQYEISANGFLADVDGTHGPSEISGDTGNPKQRAVASVTWDNGPASVTLSANYTGAFKIIDPTEGWTTCLVALQTSGDGYGAAISGGGNDTRSAVGPVLLGAFLHLLQSVRQVRGDRPFPSARLDPNLLNTQPPVDLETYGGGALYRYTTLDQDGAVGRFFLLGATYSF